MIFLFLHNIFNYDNLILKKLAFYLNQWDEN